MTQNRKWNSIINWLLIVLAVGIVFLTNRNDCHFNEEKKLETCNIAKQDSLECKQMESISSMLKKTTVQLDSIKCIQKENSKIEVQNNGFIKKSLNQIGYIEQQILNVIK